MRVGTIEVTVALFGVNSLKEKRSIVKRFLNQLRARYHCAVCESDRMDSLSDFVFGCAVVANEGAHCDRMLQEILCYCEAEAPGPVTDVHTEVL